MTSTASEPAEDVQPGGERPGRPPLGRDYWKLFGAASVSNLGDGIDAAALPLIAAALTRDPLLFAGVAVVNRLPWLLFTLHAGAIADRVDRRRLMVAMNVVRAVLFGALAVAIIGDWATIWLLYVITFLTGIAEVVFDTSWQPILPSVVRDKDQLERANGLLFGAQTVSDQFVGPPIGGFLFAVAAALPILLDAGTFLVAAGLLLGLSGAYRPRPQSPTPDDDAPRPSLRADIGEGLSWLRGHRLLRSLALLLGAMNGLTAMAFAIWPLFALEILGVDAVGFGFLLTATAAGSLLASFTAGRIVERIGRGPALWITLVGSAAIPFAQGLTSNPWVFAAFSVLFGFTAVIWNVITVSLRQTIIPDALLGRVNSVYRFLGWGSMPIGAFIGGVVASVAGLRAPFLAAGVVMAIVLVPASRVVTSRAIEDSRAAADQTR